MIKTMLQYCCFIVATLLLGVVAKKSADHALTRPAEKEKDVSIDYSANLINNQGGKNNADRN